MKNKKDDRRNNVDRIQRNINSTLHNCELADELMAKTDDKNLRNALEEKNKRRQEALSSMKSEIEDEARDKKNGYE